MSALDRRIVVRRTVTTRDRFGEVVETVTDYAAWATRLDLSQADKEQAGRRAHASLAGVHCAVSSGDCRRAHKRAFRG